MYASERFIIGYSVTLLVIGILAFLIAIIQ
jgi:hypothetical protein